MSDRLLVCSPSTRDFFPEYDRVRIIGGAPEESILDEIGIEEEVVAVGGGAVIDTAKILSCREVVCYPTTAAGSTSTSWSVYWEGTTKHSLKRQVPSEVFFDDRLLTSLPTRVIKNTTCDVISHCLDSMLSKKCTEESKSYCVSALKMIEASTETINLIRAGHVAGKAIEITGTNLLHSLSYPLTGFHGIPHGEALGYFLSLPLGELLWRLPETIDYNIGGLLQRFEWDSNPVRDLGIDMDFIVEQAYHYDKIYESILDIPKDHLKLLLSIV